MNHFDMYRRRSSPPVQLLKGAIFLTLALSVAAQTPPLQKISINYPTRTGQVWPLYIAKEGGYYAKYGYDVNLVFGVHPAGIAMLISGDAVMTAYTLEQAMIASSKDGSLVMLGTPYKKSLFAMMAAKNITSLRELKGKRIGVSQIGDAPYNYSIGLLTRAGVSERDVEWIPLGIDANARGAALVSGRVDATMLTAPIYFKLEQEGFKDLGNISDHDDIYAPSVYLFKKATLAANPKLAENLMKAHAEAIKRFYDDRAFAVKSYMIYDKQEQGDVERVYDAYAKSNNYERIPYIPAAAVKYVLDHPADENLAAQMRSYDFRKVIDNSLVDRLVREGFFEKLFGSDIKAEEDRKSKLAFR